MAVVVQFKKGLVCILVSLCLVLGMWTILVMTFSKSRNFDEITNCNASKRDEQVTLDLMCNHYRQGKISGSFCKTMCLRNSVHFQRCMGYKNDSAVFLVDLENSDQSSIVLKSMRSTRELKDALDYARSVSQEQPTADQESGETVVRTHLKRILDLIGAKSDESTVNLIVPHYTVECDKDGDTTLSPGEVEFCLRLVYTQEYLFNIILKDTGRTPHLYGMCGGVYATDYYNMPISPPPLNEKDSRPWKVRALLAIALLNLVTSYEKTANGVVFLCDMQADNFAAVKNEDGTYDAYSIDMDLSFFEKALYRMLHRRAREERECKTDKDCSLVDCRVQCKDGHCTSSMTTSNLQMMCYRIFTGDGDILWGLLHSPPQSIEAKLGALLHECLDPDSPLPYMEGTLVHSPLNTLETLKSLLTQSLE